ncbi:hypothetical protein AVEN_14245-1 [Araneus ventricosus]|uniref:Uncharacterized protein n=1 Tax=Araneus ventricosus TaxID=182803 RepID=A0A4Y2GJ87_ARAVE|nr:hypothetical protein AVEN_14245-1 [Araneus ventricosus]
MVVAGPGALGVWGSAFVKLGSRIFLVWWFSPQIYICLTSNCVDGVGEGYYGGARSTVHRTTSDRRCSSDEALLPEKCC